MSYSFLDQGHAVQEGYAWPPEMPPPEDDNGYAWPPEMPPPEDRGYAEPPEMPPPTVDELPANKPATKEADVGIGWQALIVVGAMGYLGYYYFVRR